ncbi:helix-loop-helix DNA-binding domain-containing protein [Zychaea mexicana]|uniref:helix-loop-helix DNA-binding domain-containing protein n=1 Tax=Zychaea mexicana TaxID=64656 RepID=UPI0022FE8017|nr:helix-loop-helix DNA-binding domain-containing protein [Zychaea mexicana]KAI9474882.1 helix-loop-helix DNA-binding domain-containing protein [Zychaea mexicana]
MTQRKLRNPTPYHLLATQQQDQQQWHQDDFSLEDDAYLSPLHDFDDLDYSSSKQSPPASQPTLTHQQQPHQHQHQHQHQQQGPPPPLEYQHGLLSNNEESPSEYSFASSSPSRRWPPFPMSAPAEIGFNEFYSTSSGHMNPGALALQPQPPQHGSLQDDYAVQMNLQMMMEKKRRRRESHNAVERRRRENINERIQELGTLLPEPMLDECSSNSAGGTGNKPNKGHILRKSVDHIKLLQHDVTTYQQRVRELESVLAKYQHHA